MAVKTSVSLARVYVRYPKLRIALAEPAFRLDLVGLGLQTKHLALLDRLVA